MTAMVLSQSTGLSSVRAGCTQAEAITVATHATGKCTSGTEARWLLAMSSIISAVIGFVATPITFNP